MPRARVKIKQGKRAVSAQASEIQATWPRRLTQTAFLLTLVLVIVRMSMQEIVRGAWLAVPGSTPVPAMPGPATSIGLDLLCCLPALLVLGRRIADPSFRLRFAWSFVPMFLLAIWTLLSIRWASDKFASLVGAFNWSSALVLIWSTAQLVHSGLRLRLIAAVSFGLLLLSLVQGYYYRFVDLPDLQRDWKQHHGQLLSDQGALANSTEAGQIEKNILNGVPTGFNVSRNSYAAVLVLLMVIAAGVALQRYADGDAKASWIAILPGIGLALVMLYAFVQSKTAYATPIIAAGLLMLLWRCRAWVSGHARRLYWSGVALFALLVAAVVGHGLKHGTLVHVSLTFRWQYWVGAARVFVHKPWLGTGWANFGSWYTAYRLPQAAEEPSDPHNFLVRAFVELGVFGGILMIAWVFRLWWDWTAPSHEPAPIAAHAGVENSAARDVTTGYSGFTALIPLSVTAILASAVISIDRNSPSALIIVESFKRLLFLLAFLLGVCQVSIRSFERQELDERPAWWIRTALLVGLGLFLIHNLIDFSMFEAGPMFLFALLAGAALGVHITPRGRPAGRAAMVAWLVAAGIVWLLATALFWAPITQAESLAQDAEEEVRTARPPEAPSDSAADVQKMDHGREAYLKAFDLVPYDGDYAFRAEQVALLGRNTDLPALRHMIDAAVAADPRKIRYLNARATLERLAQDWSGAMADYQRILRLDPHNLELRLQYATLLQKLGKPDEALVQYETVLDNNADLAPDEIRRLSPRQVSEIRATIEKDRHRSG